MIGERFAHWMVVADAPRHRGRAAFVCRCDCGTERVVLKKKLGKSASCGCGSGVRPRTGSVFVRWTVLSGDPSRANYWLCRCSCGTQRTIRGSSLTSGGTTSCGCKRSEELSVRMRERHTTHGRSGGPEYRAWQAMKARCYNSSRRGFQEYGGRGIRVCERWSDSFENFFMDMGAKPSPLHTVDRVDVNGHYEPRNCRWATRREQAQNTRLNVRLTYNHETHVIAEWARRRGINGRTLANRIQRGWDIGRALGFVVPDPGTKSCPKRSAA